MISILMPTFNDADYIGTAIESVLTQSFIDFELIIIDDGSTDKTRSVVESYKDPRIQYRFQENADQLNALLNGAKSISGEFVTILHSDDFYPHTEALANCVRGFREDPDIEGVYSDFYQVDAQGQQNGLIRSGSVANPRLYGYILFSGASNPFFDIFFVTREFFETSVRANYLQDNTLYYLDPSSLKVPKLKRISPYYSYRIYDQNYARAPIGAWVLYNGRLRTAAKLLENHHLPAPFFPFQLGVPRRWINRIIPGHWKSIRSEPFPDWDKVSTYLKSWTSEINKLGHPLPKLQLQHMISSAESRLKSSNLHILRLTEQDFSDWKSYEGKDARHFFRDYERECLPRSYEKVLTSRFDQIEVAAESDLAKAQAILQFLCLFYPVQVARRTHSNA